MTDDEDPAEAGPTFEGIEALFQLADVASWLARFEVLREGQKGSEGHLKLVNGFRLAWAGAEIEGCSKDNCEDEVFWADSTVRTDARTWSSIERAELQIKLTEYLQVKFDIQG